MVADCDPVGVFPKVGDDRLCPVECLFAMGAPFLFVTGIHQLMECVMVPVFFGCPAKHKAAVLPEPLQFRHVLAAELPGDNMDGEEKTVPFPFPVVLRIKPSAQHDDMDMGVEVHFRPPGMEEAEVTNLCTQVFWVCTKLVKGAGSSMIERIIQELLVAVDDGG